MTIVTHTHGVMTCFKTNAIRRETCPTSLSLCKLEGFTVPHMILTWMDQKPRIQFWCLQVATRGWCVWHLAERQSRLLRPRLCLPSTWTWVQNGSNFEILVTIDASEYPCIHYIDFDYIILIILGCLLSLSYCILVLHHLHFWGNRCVSPQSESRRGLSVVGADSGPICRVTREDQDLREIKGWQGCRG